MKRLIPSLIAASLLTMSFAITSTISWKAEDAPGAVTFSGGKVSGSFKGLEAKVELDPKNLDKSSIIASIDANSINTGNRIMQDHALSEEALNGEKFKTIEFKSTNITLKDNAYIAEGELTMKGVTQKVSIPFSFENTDKTGMLKGTFHVAPKEYGLTRGGVPSDVEIVLNVPFKQ